MLCYVQWIGAPLGDEVTLIPCAFFQWNNMWDIPYASGSMESEIYAIHTATKGAAPNRGMLDEIDLHDGSATSIAVDSMSSKVVLQGEHAEKNSTGIMHIDRCIMATHELCAAGWLAPTTQPTSERPSSQSSSSCGSAT
jgi:hypothetical protein